MLGEAVIVVRYICNQLEVHCCFSDRNLLSTTEVFANDEYIMNLSVLARCYPNTLLMISPCCSHEMVTGKKDFFKILVYSFDFLQISHSVCIMTTKNASKLFKITSRSFRT